MADGGDTLGSLPPPRVKFKEKMEDIREATIEGSQFEAQFPEERAPISVPINSPRPSPRPQTPRHSNASDATNRPKTTIRRTTSERTVADPNEEDQSNLSLSRKSTHESMARKSAYDSPTISRKSTQEHLGRKSSLDGSISKPGTGHHSTTKTSNTSQPNTPRKANGNGNLSYRTNDSHNGSTTDGIVSDHSRVSSQLSFNHSRSDSVGKSGKPGNRSESGYKLTSRNASEIVQKKGKVMENGW